ncbi:MAG: bactofilin family protein [Luteimonas sp.]
MAIFNQANTAKKDTPSFASNAPPPLAPVREAPSSAEDVAPGGTAWVEHKESLIAADLTIEGKIEGSGHVRIAGKFKGDVNVKGDLTIEKSAKLSGGVRADKVTVAGELEGNIESATQVEMLDSAVMTGDLKAGALTVAAGSRIRGHVECGWGDADAHKANGKDHNKGGKAEVELNS